MNGLLPALPSLLIGILHQNLDESQGYIATEQQVPVVSVLATSTHILLGLIRGQQQDCYDCTHQPGRYLL